MIILSNAVKNIRRYARKSTMYALICVVAVLTLQTYIANIDRTEKQLADLPSTMPVQARIASLSGSSYAALQIRQITIDGLLNSPYVRDLHMTIALLTSCNYFPARDIIDESREYKPGVVAANCADAVELLKLDAITWLPGYSADILESSEPVCIASEDTIMVYNDWSLGDGITLELYKYKYETNGNVLFDEIGPMDVRIVGSASMNVLGGNSFIIPFEAARAFASNRKVELPASTGSFYVRDPLRLNEFKDGLKKLALLPAVTDGSAAFALISHSGTSLLVYDATFISAATQLDGTISLLRGFLPLMLAVLAAIGYFVAYLMIQNRREEYAVLRLIGMSRRAAIAMYFCEMAILTLGGSIVGAAISTATGIGSAIIGALVFLIFSLCFMLGCAIALFRLGRTNVMLALSQRD